MRKVILFVLLSLSFTLYAQEKTAQSEQTEIPTKQKGSIKGRVVGDDGQPMEGVQVNIWGIGEMNNSQSVTTDEEGNFIAEGLTQIPYRISAYAKGFILPPSPAEARHIRIGEFANLSLVKGGVITGRVTNAQGEPVIGVRTQVFRLRDAEGKKVAENNVFGYRNFKTDDRGMYRYYGLPAGKYLVSVGGRTRFNYGPSDVRDTDTPTFYPSSTKDTAVEVSVNLGEEVPNVNIRYRGEKGASISGNVAGEGTEKAGVNDVIEITLLSYPNHTPLNATAVFLHRPSRSFALFGLADGDYELVANTNGYGTDPEQKLFVSLPRRVSIKGGNVENVILQLQALASVAGKIVVESVPEKPEKNICKSERKSLPDEIVIKINQDVGDKEAPYNPWSWENTSAPNDKGDISFRNLFAGHYFLTTQLPDETWYVKAITLPQQTTTALVAKANAATEKAPAKIDVGKHGLTVSAGEKRKDLLLTIASGAASFSGKLVAAPNKTMPARMRIHLIPAEKDAADDLLRYAEYKIKTDGAFQFANLAPGKYWLVARAIAEEESDEKNPAPLAWDAAKRIALRREAEAKNELIELSACQPHRDYELKISGAK